METRRLARLVLLLLPLGLLLAGCDSDDDSQPSGGSAGSGGAGGGGGWAGSGGSGGSAGSGGSGGSGGGGGALPVRLFVAQEQAVGPIAVWDDPGSLTSDVAPDATFGHASDATNVAGMASRLFAFRAGAFDIYEQPAALGNGAAASASVTSASIGSFARPRVLGGHLWVATGSPGNVLLFANADSLSSASTQTAEFTHEWGQLSDVAYLQWQDRLLATQVSGAGLLAYDTASTATGTVEQDWVFSASSGWSMALADNSLYVSGGSVPSGAHLRVYRDVSSISTTAPPDVEVTSGLDDCLWIGEFHGRLVMLSQVPGRAFVFHDASAITSGSTADEVIDLPDDLPLDMWLDRDDNLYVLDAGHVYIYGDAAGTPTLRATLDTGVDSAKGLWVLE